MIPTPPNSAVVLHAVTLVEAAAPEMVQGAASRVKLAVVVDIKSETWYPNELRFGNVFFCYH